MKNVGSYTRAGVLLSVFWLILVLIFVLMTWPDVMELALNEVGDFLAGISAPLALMWLVIGYFQHGAELKLNTKALDAQQEELKKQVEETAILARNSERQAKAYEAQLELLKQEAIVSSEKEKILASPLFVSKGGQTNSGRIRCRFKNAGAPVRNISIESEEHHDLAISPTNILESGQEGTIVSSGITRFPYSFIIYFENNLGEKCSQCFVMESTTKFKLSDKNK